MLKLLLYLELVPPQMYALSLHDALPISLGLLVSGVMVKVLVLVLLALLWAVTVCEPVAAAATDEVQAHREVLLRLSPPPLLKPLGLGKLSLRMPESPSVEVAAAWKLPDL